MKKTVFFSVCALLFVSCTQFNNNSGGVPPQYTYQITFNAQKPNTGKVTAKLENGRVLPNGERVAKDTVVIFTAEPEDGHYINKWTELEGLDISADKKTAKLKVSASSHVEVVFEEFDIQGLVWDAYGTIADTDGKLHNLRIAIGDDGNSISFFDKTESPNITYPANASYDKTSQTVKVLNQPDFTIKFKTFPSGTPATWKIEFESVAHLKYDDKELKLKKGQAEVTVKYNTLVK